MKQTNFCPNCSQNRSIRTELRSERYKVRGELITTEHPVSVCEVCGEVFSTAEQTDVGLKRSFDIYRKKHNIVSPEQIISLRQKYGASQKAFGTILGFGELTINSYEQGSLPSEAHLNVLEMASDPVTFDRMFQKAKSELGPTQLKRIQSALSIQLTRPVEPVYSTNRINELADSVGESLTVYSGWSKPAPDKLVALIAAIVNLVDPPLYKMKLLKLMFYSDFSFFRKMTHSISGWHYAAIPYGPVPNDFNSILLQVVSDGTIKMEPDEDERGDLISLDKYDLGNLERVLDPPEIETIRMVCEKLGKRTAKELSALTHKEDAWLQTEHASLISYEHALTLKAV